MDEEPDGAAATVPPRPAGPSLSPSRAGDFTRCPLVYRFRVLDRIPEEPSAASLLGTLVHAVLERLLELPPAQRDEDAARALVTPAWEALLADRPQAAELFADDDARADWMAGAWPLLERYFALEDPRRVGPAEQEVVVEATTTGGLRLRGVLDRLDEAPTGELRVVDYKTGRAPPEGLEHRALQQLRFYGLALWRSRGVVPRRLQLVYLGDGVTVSVDPDEASLLATERRVEALWEAIDLATRTGDWRPRVSTTCTWCSYRPLCPAWGGTPPPLPPPDLPPPDPPPSDPPPVP